MKIKELNDAKANKWLETTIADGIHGTLTRRQLIALEMVGKTTTTDEYASKKINGTYKKLKTPAIKYWLEMNWRGETYSKQCPKYVYDYVITAELS